MSDAGTAAAGGGTGPSPVTAPAATATPAATPPAPAATNGNTAPAWYASLGDENVGWLQAKGWNDPDPAKMAPAIAKAYRDLEGYRGVPGDQIFKWPKPDEGMESVWSKLGVPAKPEEYQFANFDWQQTEDAKLTKQMFADLGVKHHLTEEQLGGVLDFFKETTTGLKTEDAAAKEARVAAANEVIKNSWGANFAANEALAQNGLQRIVDLMETAGHKEILGRSQGALEALRDAGFGDWGNELLRIVGAGLREDTASAGTSAGRAPAQTREEAKFQLTKYHNINSPEGQAYARGDPTALRTVRELIQQSHAGEEGW